MDFYLLVIGIFVVVSGYLRIFLCYLKFRRIYVKSVNGFDIAKDITTNYDTINVVEKDVLISNFSFRRNVIYLSKRLYCANDVFSLGLVSFLAGVSISNSTYVRVIKKVFPTIDFFNKSSLLMVILSLLFYSKGDARIGIVLGIIIIFYQYLYLQIFNSVMQLVLEHKLTKKESIQNILLKFYSSNILFFVSSLIFILRFVFIIVN